MSWILMVKRSWRHSSRILSTRFKHSPGTISKHYTCKWDLFRLAQQPCWAGTLVTPVLWRRAGAWRSQGSTRAGRLHLSHSASLRYYSESPDTHWDFKLEVTLPTRTGTMLPSRWNPEVTTQPTSLLFNAKNIASSPDYAHYPETKTQNILAKKRQKTTIFWHQNQKFSATSYLKENWK